MEHEFYKGRLSSLGYSVLTPDATGRADVHEIIFQELCKGEVRESSRARYLEIVQQFGRDGAQAVVLGCTEIGMLLPPDSACLPLLDTTVLHVQAALDMALEQRDFSILSCPLNLQTKEVPANATFEMVGTARHTLQKSRVRELKTVFF
eukprot:TRINITY_DN8924_c0_g3_i1.p2 TRINITY_DN8924_c0_g3~~TRINITY_DN8924_c0_g3_i1.p2  ORF type:complete len:149 (+),score=17.18 TRINITY_DN8924_c0_g3_i1:1-447(+)